MKLLASPPSKRDRHYQQKAASTSEQDLKANRLLNKNKRANSKGSSDYVTQATDGLNQAHAGGSTQQPSN